MSYWTGSCAADNRLMQKVSRSSQRPGRVASLDSEREEASSQSYFQWREQTVRMPAVSVTVPPSRSSSFVRLLRRLSGKV
jgi:hypothetical protein